MQNELYGIIYLITNLVNGKMYVGQTIKTASARFVQHIWTANNKDGHLIHNAIRKYGSENFKISIIDAAFTAEELDYKETWYIQSLNCLDRKIGYNLKLPIPHTEGYRKKLSESHLGDKNHSYREDIDTQQLVDLYETGLSIAEVARKLGLINATVADRLKKVGVEIRTISFSDYALKGPDSPNFNHEVPTHSLIQEYNSGMSTVQLAEKYQMNKTTIRRRLIKNGVVLRDVKESRKISGNGYRKKGEFKHSPETIESLAEITKKRLENTPHPMLGKKHTEESRNKMVASRTGKPHPRKHNKTECPIISSP